MDAFISRSSADRAVASELEQALEAAGLTVCLDESEIRLGALLGQQLQDSIRASQVLLLLWSEHAASSRWVAQADRLEMDYPEARYDLSLVRQFKSP